jgi:hypothetical protein
MSELHVNQIKGFLTREFTGKIDLTDAEGNSDAKVESLFLSRSLSAYALVTLVGIPTDQAAAAVTDGYQDNGIDAIYFDPTEKQLYLVQSKWSHDGGSTVDRGSAQKFIQGVRDLVNGQFDRFNKKVQAKKSEVEQALLDASASFVLVIVHTGTQPLGAEPQRDLEDFLAAQNDVSEIMRLKVLRQVDVHSAMATGTKGSPINLDVTLNEWGQAKDPVFSVYGQVSASDVADWVEKHGPSLFAPNLRLFLGKTEVNQDIVRTLQSDAAHFWYYNNGITALCSGIEKKPFGGDGRDFGIFECKDLSITRYTNTQNRIEKKDFVALDAEQERIRVELQVEGITYVYKSGGEVPKGVAGFDLTEATVALACASPIDVGQAVQAKREISRLWENISGPPYKILFNSGTFGPQVWQLVLAQRVIDHCLQEEAVKMSGRSRLIAVHGNRLVAWLVHEAVRGKGLSDEQLKDETRRYLHFAVAAVNEVYPDSYAGSLFKNLTKCKKLVGHIQSEAAKPMS